MAWALAQDPQVIVLDEPTNHLDIRHQLELLALLRGLGLGLVGRKQLLIFEDLDHVDHVAGVVAGAVEVFSTQAICL